MDLAVAPSANSSKRTSYIEFKLEQLFNLVSDTQAIGSYFSGEEWKTTVDYGPWSLMW